MAVSNQSENIPPAGDEGQTQGQGQPEGQGSSKLLTVEKAKLMEQKMQQVGLTLLILVNDLP